MSAHVFNCNVSSPGARLGTALHLLHTVYVKHSIHNLHTRTYCIYTCVHVPMYIYTLPYVHPGTYRMLHVSSNAFLAPKHSQLWISATIHMTADLSISLC